jgi:hypothetical protein
MKKFILPLIILFAAAESRSQEWQHMMNEPGRNFYEIQASFNEYWKDKEFREKGVGFKPFKRWEHRVAPRVYPSGDLSQLNQTWKNFSEFQSQEMTGKMQASSTWTPMGPFGSMSGLLNNLPRNAGRDNFITFHPSLPNSYWAGAPAGGLWETSNDGTSWATNTDNLPVTGCSDLAVDPTNPTIMYLATGDGDGGDTESIGILKSTNGGATWASR